MAAAIAAGALACGPAESPLGGPYGGTETPPPPTSGDSDAGSGSGSGSGGTASSSSGSGSGSGSSGGAGSGGAGSGGASSGGASSGGTSSGGTSSGGTSSGGTSSGGTSSGGTSSGGSSGASSSGASSGSGGAAPTWTGIFQSYLASGTEGHCASCHGQTSSATNAYSWLKSKGYIAGTGSALASNGSCLTFFGGNMPPGGPSDAQAAADVTAWVAAGAPND